MNESDENEDEPDNSDKPRPVEEPPDTIPETIEGRRRSSQKFRALFGEKICTCPEDCEVHGPRTE